MPPTNPEARKVWRSIKLVRRKHLLGGGNTDTRAHAREVLSILTAYGQQQREAGYKQGHEDVMRFRIRDEQDRHGVPCQSCCGCQTNACRHSRLRCSKCVMAGVQPMVRSQAEDAVLTNLRDQRAARRR